MFTNKKTLLLVAGLFLVLGLAASARAGYCEQWPMPFGSNISGCIIWNDNTYYPVNGSGSTWCREGQGQPPNTDLFVSDSMDFWAWFVCSSINDTIKLVEATYSTHDNTGWEGTGQSSTREGAGTWCGYDEDKDVYFWGNWDTDEGGQYFDYNQSPPEMTIRWTAIGASSGSIDPSWADVGGDRLQNVAQCFQ